MVANLTDCRSRTVQVNARRGTSPRRSSMPSATGRYTCGLLQCALLAWSLAAVAEADSPAAGGDPLTDYVHACEAPYFDFLSTLANPGSEEYRARSESGHSTPQGDPRSASEASCSAFIGQLRAVADSSPEGRLALLKARAWVGDYHSETFCAEVRVIAEDLPEHPEALYELAQCAGAASVRMPLLQKVLEIEPRHHNALKSMVRFFSPKHDDEVDYGMDDETLARHRNALYEVAKLVDYKIEAAGFIYRAAIDAGDRSAGEAIRDRLRRDLDLDALDYGPARRGESLDRVCSRSIFDLDLDEFCLAAVETLAGEAATAGASIPGEVLRHMETAFELLRYRPWMANAGAAERVKALLEAHPEPLWTSEHHRVHAMTATVWEDRIASLRRAVDLDYGNLRARCDLAEALGTTGGRTEAAALYLDLTSDSPPCNPGEALNRLEEQARRGTKPLASPESPVEFFLH